MKQKLLNKLWLRVGMIVAIMTTALSGTAWAETKTEGFEAATASTTYNSTATIATNKSDCGIGWEIYYGNVSTTSAITGTKSCLMRYYTTSSENLGYAKTTTGIQGLTNVTFNAKVTNTGNKMGVWYSTDGSNWTALATEVTLKTNSESKSYDIPNSSTSTTYYIKIGITSATTNKKDLIIDDVVFTYSTGGTPSTYTISFDAGNGTFVGNTDFPNTSNTGVTAGSYTLPSATPPTGYKFDGWLATGITEPITGSFTVSGDVDFTASYSDVNSHTYNFAGANNFYTDANLTTHPSYGSSNNVGTIYYSDGAEFVASGTNYYFSADESGYFMLGKSGAKISLPTFDGYKITQVKLHSSSGHSTNVAVSIVSGSNTASAAQTWSTQNQDYIYNITSDYQTATLSVQVTNAYNAQFTSITLVCEELSNDPIINATDPEALAYNATEGSIAYTLINEKTDGELTAEVVSGTISNLTIGTITNSTVPFTCNANAEQTTKTAIVRLTYTYNTNETVIKDVTITQAAAPVTYTTIPALFEAATTTATEVKVTFNNWVVSGVSTNGKNVFVTDNSGNGFVIYYGSDMSSTFAAGKILSGTAVSCKVQLYNGFAEVTNLDASNLTITDGGTVSTANITLADLSGVHTGALVHYENLTCSINNNKYYLSDGTTTIQVYNSLFAFEALEAGKTYNITGIYEQFNSTKEILPRSAADIVEVQVQHNEYDLTVSNLENVELFVFDAADDSNSLLDGEGTIQVYDGTAVMISVSAESGYVLESLTVDGNDVTSHIDESGAYTFTMPTHAVTVTATAVAVTPPTPASGKYVKVTSTDDLTDGQYLIVYEDGGVAFDGSLETLDATGNTIEVTINNNEIAATSTTTAAEFTIDVTAGTIKSASGEYIFASTYNNELKTSTSVPENTNTFSFNSGDAVISVAVTETQSVTLRYNSASNQTRFRYYKSGQQAIQLYKKVESVTVTTAGYATYCSENALDFTNTDIKAYVGTKSGDKLTFTPINQVPANTGMLLVYAGGKTENVPVIASAPELTITNCLTGVLEQKTLESTDYILNVVNGGAGFYKAGTYTTLGAHKAYIPAAVGNGVKGFTIDLDDDATGISLMEDGRSQMEDGVIYNLAGQRISKMQKGINIVNGKKILK